MRALWWTFVLLLSGGAVVLTLDLAGILDMDDHVILRLLGFFGPAVGVIGVFGLKHIREMGG